jgi:hypothetical protein
VTDIAQHPDYQRTVDAAGAAAAEHASLVADLCMLAGEPNKAAEFLASKASIADVRQWAREQRAKGNVAGVSGLQPAPETTKKPETAQAVTLDVMAIFAKRETVRAQANEKHRHATAQRA